MTEHEFRLMRGLIVKRLLERGYQPPKKMTERGMHRLLDTMQKVPSLFGNDATLELSPAQVAVLEYASFGKGAKQIASEMAWSEHTVMDCQKKMRAKLGARTLAHAVRLGFEAGILREAA